jgi:metalloendopeptidase OMA1, mitochondrial
MNSRAKAVVGFLVGRPLVAIALAATVVGIMLLHTHRQKTPVTHRVEHVTLTDAQQMQLGTQEYAKTLRENRARIVSSGPQYAEVQRVARRIESVASRDKPNFVWRVSLIKKNEANAFCLPGGKIVVYTGILPLTENDAGLATVLGHEVAHATAEHVAERIERNHLTEVAATIIAGGVAFTPGQFVRIQALLGVGSPGRLLRSRAGSRAHPLEHRHSTVRRQLRRPREGRTRRPGGPAALPGGDAHSRRRTSPLPTTRAAGARERLPADEP